MDYLEKTQDMLKTTEQPKERIAVECNISLGSVYTIMRPGSNPGYRNLKAVYEYLSGRKMEV